MTQDQRRALVSRLEERRQSKVIAYITGDQAPFITQIADDAVRLFRRHLDALHRTPRIDLFLYSRGGDMLTPLRLVRLIREHCDRFSVLIPYRAHSAATSIALGADEIVMGKSGELTPVDATTAHPFNPPDPSNPQQRLPISVEDITSFFILAKEGAGVRDEQMAAVFNQLTSQIPSLALGNAHRTYRMARYIIRKLLSLHMDPYRERAQIDAIVKHLMEEISIHSYPVSRKEAKDEIGLKVVEADGDIEQLMWTLLEEYEQHLGLLQAFEPAVLLGSEQSVEFERVGACIESMAALDDFVFRGQIAKVQTPQGPAVNLNLRPPSWVSR